MSRATTAAQARTRRGLPFVVKDRVGRLCGALFDLDRQIARPGHRYAIAYHRVITADEADADGVHSSLWISPETFTAQVQWMKRVGQIVDHRTLLDFAQPNERPWFALTFDDGWRDTYDAAFPIMRREGVPATVFLVSAAIDEDALFWTQDVAAKTRRVLRAGGAARVIRALARQWPTAPAVADAAVASTVDAWIESLKTEPLERRTTRVEQYLGDMGTDARPLRGYLMSWDQAREMSQHGMSFGSHTHTHEILEGLPAERAEYECATSRRIIAERLRQPVDAFCYPNARFSGDEGTLLERAGFACAFCIDGRRVRPTSNRYFLPRFLASEATVSRSDYFRLHLLEAPFYAGRPHRPNRRART